MKIPFLKKGHLYNMILPLVFWEWWYVVLAFIFVVLLETYVVNIFIKDEYKRIFKILFKANLITTIGGYILQGILRLIIGMILYITTEQYFESYPVIRGILGNVGIGKEYIPEFTTDVIATIATSIILTFTLSVIIERRIVLKNIDKLIDKSLVSKAVILANIISYTLLTIWICYNYLRIDT